MARQLGISRPTVYAYLRRDTTPGPRRLQRLPSARVLTPYVPYLIRRWRESGADSRQLWREIQTLGYTHSARTVCRLITRLRRAADAGQPPESQRSPYMRSQGPSARAVSFVMACQAAKRSAEAETYLDQLCQMDASITRAYRLTQAFLALVRERRGSDLEAWITAATDSGIDALARFARGLRDDLAAVTAGVTLPWSNGPVEGQITRLKLLKRQGYGRTGFARSGSASCRPPRGCGRRVTMLRPPRTPAPHGVGWPVAWAAHSWREEDTVRSPPGPRQSMPKGGGPTLLHQN